MPGGGLGETVVRGEIKIEPRHPVEPEHQVELPVFGITLHLVGKIPGTGVVGKSARREKLHCHALRRRLLAAPLHRTDGYFVTATDRLFGDPQHVALKPAVRKITEDREEQIHGMSRSSVSSARISR